MAGKEWIRLERTAFADGVAVFTNGAGYEVRIPTYEYEALLGEPEQITVAVENAQPVLHLLHALHVGGRHTRTR